MKSNSDRVVIPDVAAFCAAFGELGLRVGSRTGADKRTQDQKEWYVVRRFLKEAMIAKIFEPPITIWKASPPDPDFALEFGRRQQTALIEITEATDPADQREMTEFELSDRAAMLIGELGGRFSDGASQPGHAWAADVIAAIQRKTGKAIFCRQPADRHLVIYPNSNASFLVFDDEDERTAFSILERSVSRNAGLSRITSNCSVHVLGKEFVCFDLLGNLRLAKRV